MVSNPIQKSRRHLAVPEYLRPIASIRRSRSAIGTSRQQTVIAVAVELTTYDLNEIEQAAAKITVQGNRYPDKLEELTGR